MTEQQPEPPAIEVVRGEPTPEELAALLAVLGETYADEVAGAVAAKTRISAWDRTRRGLRTPLRRDIPWGRYSG
ncbi:MAG: acyl-CoA carboxylase subunit epsilon [Microbacterium sp.]